MAHETFSDCETYLFYDSNQISACGSDLQKLILTCICLGYSITETI